MKTFDDRMSSEKCIQRNCKNCRNCVHLLIAYIKRRNRRHGQRNNQLSFHSAERRTNSFLYQWAKVLYYKDKINIRHTNRACICVYSYIYSGKIYVYSAATRSQSHTQWVNFVSFFDVMSSRSFEYFLSMGIEWFLSYI